MFTNAAHVNPYSNNETHCYPYRVVDTRMPEIDDSSRRGQLGLDIMNNIHCETIQRLYLVMSPDRRVTFINLKHQAEGHVTVQLYHRFHPNANENAGSTKRSASLM
jgi:hypothetical protein